MTTIWLIVGVAVAGAVAVIAFARPRGRDTDLGSVSSQWVTEHRLSQHDSRR